MEPSKPFELKHNGDSGEECVFGAADPIDINAANKHELLAQVAKKLKGRTLFPEALADAQRFLNAVANNPFENNP